MAPHDPDSPDSTEPPHPPALRRPQAASARPVGAGRPPTARGLVDLDLGQARRQPLSAKEGALPAAGAHDIAVAPTVRASLKAPALPSVADATMVAGAAPTSAQNPSPVAATLVPQDRDDAAESVSLAAESDTAADPGATILPVEAPRRTLQQQSTARAGSAATGAARRVVVGPDAQGDAPFRAAETLQMQALGSKPTDKAQESGASGPADTVQMAVLTEARHTFAAAETIAMPTLSEPPAPEAAPEPPPPQLVRNRAAAATRREPVADIEPPATRPRTSSDRLATVTDAVTTQHQAIPGPWRVLFWMAAVFAGLALALPTDSGPPWKLLLQPTGVTFHALLVLLLLVAVGAAGLAPRAWRTGMSVVAIVAAALGWLVMRDAVALDAFDGQPAVTGLWGGAGLGGALVVLGGALVGGGAIARAERPRGPGPTVVIVVGLVLLGLVLGGVGGAGHVGHLVESLLGARFAGDRVGAWTLVPVFGLLVPVFFLAIPGFMTGAGRALGLLVVTLLAVPLLVLSAYVSPATNAVAALAPLKATAFGAAGLWLLALAVGSWFRSVGPAR